jgi:tRNA(fMet)-specific endonuclease VapC
LDFRYRLCCSIFGRKYTDWRSRSENKLLAKKRLEKDIRIAAIVLANNGIMVTRNRKDFSLIPNLQIEDWTD